MDEIQIESQCNKRKIYWQKDLLKRLNVRAEVQYYKMNKVIF